jgi:hypothetical protein
MIMSHAGRTIVGTPWPQSIVGLQEQAAAKGWSHEDLRRLWAANDLAAELFTGRFRGSGRPFVDHLAGTAALALHYGGNADEVLAAFLHAAYAQGAFDAWRDGPTKKNRAKVRTVLGALAEGLVARYDLIDWMGIAGLGDPCEVAALAPQDQRVVFLHMVNEIEDSLDYAAYDENWRSGCLARLAAAAMFAEHMDLHALAEGTRARHTELRNRPSHPAPVLRPKRSVTIIPATARARHIRQVFDRLRRLARRWR